MANKIKVRDVGLREIYDSYMGIIRISPDKDMNDDISSAFLDGSEIELSDSDGNPLGLTFTGKTSQTTVLPLDKNGNKRIVNLVSVVSRVKDILFAVESVNVRSTLYLGRKENERYNTTNLMVVSKKANDSTIRNVLMYPSDSPYCSSYWNNLESKVSHQDLKKYSGEYDEQLEQYLYEQPASWYTLNTSEDDYVKVNGKTVYITNTKDELIPVLRDKCCVLGNRKDATSIITNGALLDNYVNNFYGFKNITNVGGGPYIRTGKSFITRLSFFNVDDMIWEGVGQVMNGNIRHNGAGRYRRLGAKTDTDLYNEYGLKPEPEKPDYSIAETKLRAYTFIDTAPLLGSDVEPGLIIYNAMPLKKFAYSALRQIKTNKEKKYISNFGSNKNAANVDSKFKNMLTAAGSGEKTDSIRLVKNFILCDGNSINHENYPYVNGKNDKLNMLIDGNPPKNTIYSSLPVSQSSSGIRVAKTAKLLDWHSTASRLLRGQMWCTGNENIDYYSDKESVIDVKNSYEGLTAGDYGCEIEVIEKNTLDNPYSTRKNITTAEKPYMSNYDSRICRSTHKHKMFSSMNGAGVTNETLRNAPSRGGGLFFMLFRDRAYGIVSKQTVIAGEKYCRNDRGPSFLNDRVNVNPNALNAVPWYINANSNVHTDNKENKIGLSIVETDNSPYNVYLQSVKKGVKKDFDKIKNELEAAKPISCIGGATDYCYFENGYTVREGENHQGESHETVYKYSLDKVGGYNIQAQTTYKEGDKWGDTDEQSGIEKKYIELGLSSLPYTDREKLGDGNTLIKDNNDNIKYKEEQTIGETTVPVYNNVPSPPAINLLPLLRI